MQQPKKNMQTWKLFYIWNNGKKQILNFNSIKFIFKMWIQYDFYDDDDDSQFFTAYWKKVIMQQLFLMQ